MGIHPDTSTYARQNALTRVQSTNAWIGLSWVIVWSNTDWWAEDRARVLNEIYRPTYSASGDLKPRFAARDRGQILDVAGQIVGHIIFTIKPPWDETDLSTQLRAIEKHWHAQDPRTVTKSSAFNRFWRTLLADNIIIQPNPVDVFPTYAPMGNGDVFEPPKRRARATDIFAFLLWWIGKHPELRQSQCDSKIHFLLSLRSMLHLCGLHLGDKYV